MNTVATFRKGLFLVLVSLIIVISSCTKKGTEVTPIPKKTTVELLTGSTYTLTNYEGSTDGTTWKALTVSNETLMLKADGTFSDMTSGGGQTGSWKVSADSKVLTYGSTDYDIVSADEKTLVTIDHFAYATGGVTYTQHRWTWTKK